VNVSYTVSYANFSLASTRASTLDAADIGGGLSAQLVAQGLAELTGVMQVITSSIVAPPCSSAVSHPFPTLQLLKAAVDSCLDMVPGGESCCSLGGADCGLACGVDMPEWDTSQITSMEGLFELRPWFDQDISGWNVGRVTDMSHMFWGATSFNQDLSDWDVSNVEKMFGTLYRAAVFNGNISAWNVGKVTNMRRMFEGNHKFNGDISSWNVGNVADMHLMFRNASTFNTDISQWNVGKVTNMQQMFAGAGSFSANINDWTTVADGNYRDMFHDATKWFNAYINCDRDDSSTCSCMGMYDASTGISDGPPRVWKQFTSKSWRSCYGVAGSRFPGPWSLLLDQPRSLWNFL